MPEVDVSSYPKPQQQNFLDTAAKLQGLESNKIGIDQQKLKLANEHFNIVNQTLGTLLYKPDVSAKDIIDESQKLVKLGLMTPDHFSQFVSSIPSGTQLQKNPNAIRDYLTITRNRAISNMEALNWYGGQGQGFVDTGNAKVPFNVQQGVIKPTGGPIPTQLPVTTPGFNPAQNREQPIGSPSFPPGNAGPSGGFPGQGPLNPKPVQTIPVGRNALPVQEPQQAQNFNDRFNQATGVMPGSPPFGTRQASDIAGAASGEALAKARNQAANFQRDVFPLAQAIPALEKLGTKGTGPGTETINHIKSFVLSNVPGVKESDFNGTVADYDKAKKYLTDFVNQTGNSGTNDKLAAAFAGNPSVHISNAAAQDVAKSALALRLMQQAQYLEFEKSGKPDSEFSRWIAQKNNQLDPRAFGVNYMSPDSKRKLLEQLNKNPKEKELFEKSIQIAHDAGYIVLGK